MNMDYRTSLREHTVCERRNFCGAHPVTVPNSFATDVNGPNKKATLTMTPDSNSGLRKHRSSQAEILVCQLGSFCEGGCEEEQPTIECSQI
jgi:hypothetical protein